MLANIVEDHLLRDWCNLVQADLAVEALDIKLTGIAKATKGLHRVVHRVTAGLGGEEFRDVCLSAAWQRLVIQPGRLECHQFSRFQTGVRLGQGKLYALILANGAS